MASSLSDRDVEQLEQCGIAPDEARRQLGRFRQPPTPTELLRPCTVDDGIRRLGEVEYPALLELHAEAAAAGRLLKFVPASGAASRMFADLHAYSQGAEKEQGWTQILDAARDAASPAATLVTLLEQIDDFAFHASLRHVLQQRNEPLEGLAGSGSFRPILDALLGPDGLDYARQPKGLIEFHDYPNGARTAFEEHLAEASEYVRDASGRCRLHLTVAPEHRPHFDKRLDSVGTRLDKGRPVEFDVSYSVQSPRTDTLAVDDQGQALRDAQGRLRLRPGGHGALIENLADLGGDIVFIKNIDNVQPDRSRAEAVLWKRLLAGCLIDLQRRVFDLVDRLRHAEPPQALLEEGLEFVATQFGERRDPAQPTTYQIARAYLIDRLNRPLRVCGVVPSTGEPGGGPFWIRDALGQASLQIVEGAQLAPTAGQQEIWRKSTHFNPVDLVCGLRDGSGEPFELRRYVDPDAAIVTRKSESGREIRVLERPGLWNGAMANWNTVFVEVPLSTFTPVKTVCDLLRPEHR